LQDGPAGIREIAENQGRQPLTPPEISLEFFPAMKAKDETKLKKPHTAADLQALEDELSRVAADLRDIRTGMADRGLAEVPLMSGTFRLYLRTLREMAKTFRSVFDKELIRQAVAAERERKQQEIAARLKKH
jgi:hypothetical protein